MQNLVFPITGDVNLTLPAPGKGTNWYRVTDTCGWAEGPSQVRTPLVRGLYWRARQCVWCMRSWAAVVDRKVG